MCRHDRQYSSRGDFVVVGWKLYWLRTLLDSLRLGDELQCSGDDCRLFHPT